MKYGPGVTILKLSTTYNGKALLGGTIKIHSTHIPKSVQ
jgi:hypothetical protein